MMPFETSLQHVAFVLTEGSVYERLRRHPAVDFDPYLAHAGLLYETSAADVLAQALAETDVDFLMAATLPAFSEAHGMATAMAATGRPYVFSFVLRRDGALLAGLYSMKEHSRQI